MTNEQVTYSVARVRSAALFGVDAQEVSVEAQIAGALRRFAVVGLPDSVLRESKDRVRCAIENSGFSFPHHEVIVNLAPASLPKAGAGFDLPIALSILAADRQLRSELLEQTLIIGELGLDGEIKSVPGALATAALARKLGLRAVLVSPHAAEEAALVSGVEVIAVARLEEAVALLAGNISSAERIVRRSETATVQIQSPGFGDVVGQHAVKRALEIVAAGAHNLLMVGPPGSGKSMLAGRLTSILPPLSLSETIEVSKVYSAVAAAGQPGFGKRTRVIRTRPFRAPHHTASSVGLIGGGSMPVPGEISLAHTGVLFLDEFPEFRRDVLEALRQPLEAKRITVSRAKLRLNFPADFILLAAMNPCPCGMRGTGAGRCTCSENEIRRYAGKLSGPVLDRIDLQVFVPPVPVMELQAKLAGDPTPQMRARVLAARKIQHARYQSDARTNSHIGTRELRDFCALSSEGETLMRRAAERMQLSARGYTRMLRLARTIADLEGVDRIEIPHLTEALSYRMSAG